MLINVKNIVSKESFLFMTFKYNVNYVNFCLWFWNVPGHSRGVMVKALDYGIVVSEFELQPRYYVHFRTLTLGKGMNPIILPAK